MRGTARDDRSSRMRTSMGIKYWNVYRRSGTAACVGDKVRYQDRIWRVIGTLGADADGVPYVRLRPITPDTDGEREVVRLLTKMERVR